MIEATALPASTSPVTQPQVIAVHRTELPLSCPRPADALWNMHPRVYLPIEDEPSKIATCPYCGARYQLVD